MREKEGAASGRVRNEAVFAPRKPKERAETRGGNKETVPLRPVREGVWAGDGREKEAKRKSRATESLD